MLTSIPPVEHIDLVNAEQLCAIDAEAQTRRRSPVLVIPIVLILSVSRGLAWPRVASLIVPEPLPSRHVTSPARHWDTPRVVKKFNDRV